MVEHLVALAPDLVVISGDLTAQGLQAEFDVARAALAPVLDRFPTFVVPGNHDVYTPGAAREDRIASRFGPWLHRDGAIARYSVPGLTVFGLDPNRATWFDASGVVPQAQLLALAAALAGPIPSDDFVLLVLHYPIIGADGALYAGRSHGLRNAAELVAVLDAAPRRPDVVLHGHVHHGYRSSIPVAGDAIPSIDCGSSGHAFLPARGWYAAMNLLHVEGARLVAVDAYHHDGERFRLATELVHRSQRR